MRQTVNVHAVCQLAINFGEFWSAQYSGRGAFIRLVLDTIG